MDTKKKKITEVGQPCRHCGTPVIRHKPRTKPQGRRKYYFEFIMLCPKCNAVYHIEEAKKFWSKKPTSQGASQPPSESPNPKLAPGDSAFPQKEGRKDGATPPELPLNNADRHL
jgi:hypothetical protein